MTFLLLFLCGSAQADKVPPADYNATITQSFDRAAVPSVITLWQNQSGGYDTNYYPLWSRNSLVCYSATDASNGACRTTPVWWQAGDGNDKYIPLLFKLQNGSSTVKLTVTGVGTIAGCANYPADNATLCRSNVPERLFTFTIPNTELTKIPYPGTWTATLKQKLMQWDPRVQVATWQANITLHVSDNAKSNIYFPAFRSGTAMVNLNLTNRPGMPGNNTTASGNTSLDMCLYDGGIGSNTIALTFNDEGKSASGRPSGQFSVYLDKGDDTQTSNRLDYVVKVLNPTTGNTDTVTNGSQITWTNTNVRNIQRQVVIPGTPGVSLCVPAPITLITPSFVLSGKTAGHYSGRLSVTYTPTTSSP